MHTWETNQILSLPQDFFLYVVKRARGGEMGQGLPDLVLLVVCALSAWQFDVHDVKFLLFFLCGLLFKQSPLLFDLLEGPTVTVSGQAVTLV